MKNSHKIIFTGGGTAGHVTPNIALIKKLQTKGWEIFYLGSKNGIERDLISKLNLPYFSICSGKLRRYFSLRNFLAPFKTFLGILQSFWLCRKIKPRVVFAKGGFIAFPVVVGAWLNRIPVIAHESDFSPGLANKLCFPFLAKLCVTFAETKKKLHNHPKVIVTGTPIRSELFSGNAERGREFCKFSTTKKIILVIGGSMGSLLINKVIRSSLSSLLPNFQIIHLCGKNNLDQIINYEGYKQFEYLDQELPDIMACADFIISRSGANSVYEILSLGKPHIFIPLSTAASRGDQIENAKYFAALGFSQIIWEQDLSPDTLCQKIAWLNENFEQVKQKLTAFKKQDSIAIICDIISGITHEQGEIL